MSNEIIKIENLTRVFHVGSEDVHALKGISFSIREGEFVSIMGASGSGKSTLLNILGCLDKPTSGSYFIDDVDVSNRSKNELSTIRNRKIGFIFQNYNLLARTSALENVELPLMYNPTVSSKERRERAIEALKAVNLENRLDHMPNQLSGGQQQRVAIARALVNNPNTIIADEPTGNLDPARSLEIMRLLDRINELGTTVVVVTHERDLVNRFRKRVVMLEQGLITGDGVGYEAK